MKAYFVLSAVLLGMFPSVVSSQEASKSNYFQHGGLITIESDLQSADNVTGVFTAIGNVRIVYPSRGIVATSRQAQYFSKEDRLVLSGDVDVISNGADSIKGERVVYLFDDDEVIVHPKNGDQVFMSVRLDLNKSAEASLSQ